MRDREHLDHLPGRSYLPGRRGGGSTSDWRCGVADGLTGYMYLYDDGSITRDEYESRRTGAIEDELNDTRDCSVPAGAKL